MCLCLSVCLCLGILVWEEAKNYPTITKTSCTLQCLSSQGIFQMCFTEGIFPQRLTCLLLPSWSFEKLVWLIQVKESPDYLWGVIGYFSVLASAYIRLVIDIQCLVFLPCRLSAGLRSREWIFSVLEMSRSGEGGSLLGMTLPSCGKILSYKKEHHFLPSKHFY